MRVLTIEQIISLIESKTTFEAAASDQSFTIKVTSYKPFVCAAIHNGHQLRTALQKWCLPDDSERWYEEDPLTADFIAAFPITITGNDSRYEYDLNREPAACIYDLAWNKPVWRDPLTEAQRKLSLRKHRNFYRVVHALVAKLESLFGAAVVYDIHSYNYKRYEQPMPVFNIGAERIDMKKFGFHVRDWQKQLSTIEIPNIENIVAINDIFKGHGYFLKYITSYFNNTLVLATEIKKVYCDENTGELYPLVIEALKKAFGRIIPDHALKFARKRTSLKPKSRTLLLNNHWDESIYEIDRILHKMVWNFEILNFVNPLNIEKERKKFFASEFRYEPRFRYKQLVLDPFEFRRKLYQIPVEKIEDSVIRGLYRDVIDSYADKVDIISSIGREKFLYNSLRYYGKPDEKDLDNARYLIHLPSVPEIAANGNISAKDAIPYFRKEVEKYGFECRIDLSDRIVAKAIVINHKKQLLIRKSAKFSEQDLKALINHEIGIHMLTTMNSREQKLQLFNIGLPINDLSQEGLAIMAEYLSGNINIDRLKELAMRVLAINFMLKDHSFGECFHYLVEQLEVKPEKAFGLSARVYRGGGFTKDYLYLRGFKEVLKLYDEKVKLDNLFIGKTSIAYLPVIDELVERKLVNAPKYLPNAFGEPQDRNPIINYIISGIK
ncbi:MAG: flavohemoglobin expression-modulating QEGLA motif protein [Bacteroidota bacterium]|nr:flavohemoglobin expression-modulating QEGLA motif protein [Bacteroidota bacterium]